MSVLMINEAKIQIRLEAEWSVECVVWRGAKGKANKCTPCAVEHVTAEHVRAVVLAR